MRGHASVTMLVCCYLVETARQYRGYEDHAKEIDRALATMGRYGRQNMIDLEREIPMRRLFEMVAAVGELIDRENAAAKGRR